MSTATATPPAAPATAPAAPQTVKQGGVTITRETITPNSQPQGAQGVKPAPAGTIPPPLKPVSQTPEIGKGPARQAMLEDLRKRANPKANETKPATKTAEVDPMGESDDGQTASEDGESAAAAQGAEAAQAADAGAKDGQKKPKVNPWKLVDEWKAKTAKLEKEVSDLSKAKSDLQSLEAQKAEIEKIRARNEELEGAIALVDARKTEKFIKEYQKPYEKAWSKAMQDLRSLTVEDPKSGEERAITPQDLLKVVNVGDDLEAREIAKELFGDEEASLVMRKREMIRDLFDKQQEYLEEVGKNGSKMLEEKSKVTTAEEQKLLGELRQTWEQVSNELVSTDKMKPYFSPIEGDEKASEILEKGYQFVDEAMAANPRDPKLTPDERAKLVKKHAAIRHRAAAFNRMRYMNEKKEALIAELESKLAEYEGTTPSTAGRTRTDTSGPATSSAWDQVRADLYKLAK